MVKAAELASESDLTAGKIGEAIDVVVVDNVGDAVEVAEVAEAAEVAEKAAARAVAATVTEVTEVLFRWIALSLESVIPDIGDNGASFLGSSTSVKGDCSDNVCGRLSTSVRDDCSWSP